MRYISRRCHYTLFRALAESVAMLSLEPPIDAEYKRVLANLPLPGGVDKPDLGALTMRDVIRAHFEIVNRFYMEGEGLGGVGPRDIGLLESAVARQHVSFGGQRKWGSMFEMAATLFFGLIKNHPFHDANKRTALLSMLYQLHQVGWCPSINEQEIENFTVDIAENNLGKHRYYRELKKNKSLDAEVRFIARYLKRHTRKIDLTHRVITYRELQVILAKNQFEMANPQDNHIDIIKHDERVKRRLFGFIEEKVPITTRVGRIGFPRWTAEVARGDIKNIRELTGLTAKKRS